MRYDADEAPEPAGWLALDEWERISAVLEGHSDSDDVHPSTPNPRLHAIIHTVVETQLASDDPPSARRALARLQAAGNTRHEAVHAIGSVVSDTVIDVMQQQRPFNAAAYEAALGRLQPGDWRFGRRGRTKGRQ